VLSSLALEGTAMLQRILAGVCALILSAGAVAPFAQTDVSGSWTLMINGPQGPVDAEATFKQDGDKVTGTMSSMAGETNVAGTLSGSTLSLAFNVVTPNGPIDVKMTAEVSGEEMKGVVDFSMGTADFTGKKK
jgi:hypothetical protein